jgi:hypothetical protein
MQASSKPSLPSARGNQQLRVATFKNSLRAGQAQYKARRATLEFFCGARTQSGRTYLTGGRPVSSNHQEDHHASTCATRGPQKN